MDQIRRKGSKAWGSWGNNWTAPFKVLLIGATLGAGEGFTIGQLAGQASMAVMAALFGAALGTGASNIAWRIREVFTQLLTIIVLSVLVHGVATLLILQIALIGPRVPSYLIGISAFGLTSQWLAIYFEKRARARAAEEDATHPR